MDIKGKVNFASRSVKKILGIESGEDENDTLFYKEKLAEKLKNTDPATLKKLLDILDKKE